MSFYDDVAAEALAVLGEFGLSTSLRRVTTGVYDPGSGSAAPSTAVSAVTAAVFDFALKYIDGTKILAGDKKVLVAPGAAMPAVNDELLWQGEWWRVVSAETLAPAGTPVLYTLQVRK